MRVSRHEAVAMVDLDHPTILGMPFRVDDLAARGRNDRRSGFSGEIDPFVKRILARERIDAIWSTSPIATAQLIGLTLGRVTGLPWIADFRVNPVACRITRSTHPGMTW